MPTSNEQPAADLSKVARVKIKFNREFGEYVCKAYNANGGRIEDADYFTDDKNDAEQTAALMIR